MRDPIMDTSETSRTISFRRAAIAGAMFGVLVNVIAVPLAIGSMGAGHGDYFWANMCFPFLMLIAGTIGRMPMTLAWLSLLQYPMYGFFIGNSSARLRTTAGILLAHAAVAMASFIWRFG